MGKWMDGYLQRLEAVRRQNLEAGGKERLDLIGRLGKLTARQRIAHLVDAGSFEEIGSLVTESLAPLDGKKRPTPSDGVVMGFGEIDGRPAMVYAHGFQRNVRFPGRSGCLEAGGFD